MNNTEEDIYVKREKNITVEGSKVSPLGEIQRAPLLKYYLILLQVANLNLQLVNLKAGKYNLALIDMKGGIVYNQTFSNFKGSITITGQVKYIIQLKNNINLFTLKAIINR